METHRMQVWLEEAFRGVHETLSPISIASQTQSGGDLGGTFYLLTIPTISLFPSSALNCFTQTIRIPCKAPQVHGNEGSIFSKHSNTTIGGK